MAMKKRNPRVDGTVREAIANIIETELTDPRLGFITITEVQVSQDSKHATVYYTSLDPHIVSEDPRSRGGDRVPEEHEVAAGLEAASARIQAILSQTVRMRNTPQLKFVADPVAEQARRVDALLHSIDTSDTPATDAAAAAEADEASDGDA